MPIVTKADYEPMSRAAFGKASFAAFAEVLAIRKELGRFFDERHYKQALKLRLPDVQLEVPVWVKHASFAKPYYLDVLLSHGGILEFKAAERLTARHRSQLLHYLMLTDLRHGMNRFASHAQRLVQHAGIEALLWANIARHQVVFQCLSRHS